MSGVLSLPPELLFEIFSNAYHPRHFGLSDEFRERTRTLLAFALVHSTWKTAAMKLLGAEVRINGGEKNRLNARRRLQLLQEGPHRLRPKALQLVNVGAKLRSEIEGNVWDGLKQLREISGESLRSLSNYAQFPGLEVLHILCDGLDLSSSRDASPFRHLRRLVLVCDQVLSPIGPASNIVSLGFVPTLTHLSLSARRIDSGAFDAVLPQLRSLALMSDGPFDSALNLIHDTSLFESLEHLSLQFCRTPFPVTLFGMIAGLNLESLHLESKALDQPEMKARLVAVAKGDTEVVKSKRVVLYYGWRSEIEIKGVERDLEAFEWKEGSPPFHELDGSS